MTDDGRRMVEQARLLQDRGEIAAAVTAFEQAIAAGLDDPEKCFALTSLGASLVRLGRIEQARQVMAVATDEFPEERAVRTMFVDLARTVEKAAYVRAFDFPFLVAAPMSLRGLVDLADLDHVTVTVLNPSQPRSPVEIQPQAALEALAVRQPWVADEHEEWARGLNASEITVGRAPSNDIVIMHPNVSKMHAVFRPRDGHWELADVGSKNGTFIYQRRLSPIEPPSTIASGSYVSFGEASFLFLSAASLWEYVQP